MTKEEVYSYICVYDKRSPYNEGLEDYEADKDCGCDNCFYGRTKLAKVILNLMEKP